MAGRQAFIAPMVSTPIKLTLSSLAGIGLYVAFVGLTSSGLNVIGGNYDTIVGLAGCKEDCQS
jgi:AGZA family xanthine/uracil permease-like MFS transporter